MQATLNSFDNKKETIDHENLNIVIRPRPPRRRQSGISLVPFRPYVKKLISVKQPFSYANGYDKWMTMGRDEIFFTQPNARCIGSLLEDCDISDVIRWDIEAESTRLPMMCKLWMIVDGAIVERGKPHLVQDAAVQVLTSGRNLRTILAAYQRYKQTSSTTTSERRRRHSWHDVNEYHSVPYYQYTNIHRNGYQEGIQCDLDNEQMSGTHETLSDVEEEAIDDENINHFNKENLQEMIHHHATPQNRAFVSMTTQTEPQFYDRSTSIDPQLIQLFNLNLETNEILLSSIVNPYRRTLSSNDISSTITIYRNNIEYKHRSISTGDDYPHWWLKLTTDLILSDLITNQNEEKEKYIPAPSPRQDQSIQTDVEKSRPSSSTRSSRVPKSSSSTTTSNHYELIDEFDDRNNSKRYLTFSENSQRVDSGLSDCQIESSSIHEYDTRSKQQSLSDYKTLVCSFNDQHPDKQSHSTPDHHCFSNETPRIRTESTSTSVLASLLERYEKTLRQRQQAITIVNDDLLDIDDVLKRYRGKIQNSTTTTRSNTTMELNRDISLLSTQSKEDQSSVTMTNLIKDKYRSMPGITSDEMIQGYIPLPRSHLATSILTLPRQRQPRYLPSAVSIRPDYCDLCLTDHETSSAWIRYNERRIEELQKRIDIMLQIDDNEEARLLLTPNNSLTSTTTATVTQRIDDFLALHPRYRLPYTSYHDRLISPRLYQYRLPYRTIQSVPNSPRQLSRQRTRSTTPVSKSVRISTHSVPPPKTRPQSSTSPSRPIISILRRSSVPVPPPLRPEPKKLVESPHVWKSKVDGKIYSLDQFSIPRYYRLYNDAQFREVYNMSRVLDNYLDPNRPSATTDYSTMAKTYAVDHQLPSEITSVA